MKLITSIVSILILTGCAIGTPRIQRGNSSSVEVWAGNMAGPSSARIQADPLADKWCRQYGKDAIFIRVEHNQDFYYICNKP